MFENVVVVAAVIGCWMLYIVCPHIKKKKKKKRKKKGRGGGAVLSVHMQSPDTQLNGCLLPPH